MRNLLTFIYKNNFFFFFLLLETLAIYLVVRKNYYHRAGFINSSNVMVGAINSIYDKAHVYLSLKETSETLARENAILLSQLPSAFMDQTAKLHKVNDTSLKQHYEYLEAKVINNSTNRRNNYLTLSRGSKQGVEEDMAVFSSTGIVGVVEHVSDNFSTVMSILHKETQVNAKIKKDGNFGRLTWDGTDYRFATVSDLPTHTRLAKGDTVVTSAYSITYPENILIGTIESFGIKSGENAYTAKVRLSTEFKRLEYVYVVKNFYKDEQKALEEENKP
jgi:rod shape-determining protein MreC